MSADDNRLVPVDHGMGAMGVMCRTCKADDYFHGGRVEHEPWCTDGSQAGGSWQAQVRHLCQRVQMRQTLTEVDLDTIDEVLRQAVVCRDALARVVLGCQYIGPSHRDGAGVTEIRYEGATVLTKEQWALVELFMGDL